MQDALIEPRCERPLTSPRLGGGKGCPMVKELGFFIESLMESVLKCNWDTWIP